MLTEDQKDRKILLLTQENAQLRDALINCTILLEQHDEAGKAQDSAGVCNER